MRSIASSALALSALALLTLSACNAPRRSISAIEVVDRSRPVADPALKLDVAKARSLAESKVGLLPGFALRSSAKERRHQLSVILELSVEASARANDAGVVPSDTVYRGVGVDLSLRRLDPSTDQTSAEPDRVEARILYGRNAPVFEPLDVVLDEALSRGFTVLAWDLTLAAAPEPELVSAIGGSDLELVARAIDRAAERKSKAAVPAIVRLVEDVSLPAPLRVRCIGALVAIRDPRAVPPLIALTKGRTPAFNSQIVFGVAEIGGKEAEAWLFTVSSGHPDPELRRSATDALRELEARKRREEAKAKASP